MGDVAEPDQVNQLSRLDPHRVAVVLVDFQNDFCRPLRPDEDPAQTRANAGAARSADSG